MTTPAEVAEFIRICRESTLTERSGSQSHFIALCRLLGVKPPLEEDPRGEWFAFEKGAKKTGGGDGWADVWRRHCFAWEYKGKHKDLGAALRQLQQYALALDNPPLLIVSDMETIEIHTHFTNTVNVTHRLTLDDLANPAKLNLLRWAFLEPDRLQPIRTREAVTQDAAMLLGGLAQQLRQRGHDPQPVAHFMTRLLFCLFAEDIGLLPDRLFSKLVEASRRSPADFPGLARDLFQAMHQGGRFGLERIAWFNGGLFNDDGCLPLEKADLDTLHSAAALDWSAIEPAIFGTLFERGLDPDKRSQLGAHYTDAASIRRLIEPVIRDPLLAEWATIKAEMERGLRAKKPKRAQAEQALQGFLERLRTFRVLDPACGSGNFLYLALRTLKDIEHQVMLEAEALGLQRGFPAVGPEAVIGIEINPYAAELARLTVWIGEIQWMLGHGYSLNDQPILKPLNSIECRDALLLPSPAGGRGAGGEGAGQAAMPNVSNHPGASRHPSLSKEGNSVSEAAWPVAEVIVGNPPFLGDKKQLAEDALLDIPPEFPPCQGGVSRRDGGVLPESSNHPGAARHPSLSKEGNSVSEAAWPVAEVIVGNPPFLGGSKKRALLGDAYFAALDRIYAGRVPGGADLVCYWFEKARAKIDEGQARAAGLVATQAIRRGANRTVLARVCATTRIFCAWADEPWINDGAAVRVSLVCFGREGDRPAQLNGIAVEEIHADLTGSATHDTNLTLAKALPENAIAFEGTKKYGDFDIPGDVARAWLAAPNPHGKPNSDVVKPWRNGQDLTGRVSDTWIIDFGVNMPEAEAALYEAPFQWIVAKVKPYRETVKRERTRRRWWIHEEARVGLRQALAGLPRYIATPRVAKHRFFVWCYREILPDTRLLVIARADDATFGILSSYIHRVWALANASRHGDGEEGGRPTYNAQSCFETFPFPAGLTPNIPAADYADHPHAQAIADAARNLNTLRENWLNPPQWIDRVPEVVPGYPDRIIPKPEHAAELKKRTLTNLYNQHPTWLDHAHRTLDEAVAAAYGWPADLSDDEVLRRLLALNRERTH